VGAEAAACLLPGFLAGKPRCDAGGIDQKQAAPIMKASLVFNFLYHLQFTCT